MPRLDSRDPSPPLRAGLPTTDLDQISPPHHHSSTSASLAAPLDRRFSHTMAVYPANSASSASSRHRMHTQDKEFNSPPLRVDSWSALSNRHTPSFSTPHPSSSNHHRSPPILTPPAVLPASSAYHNPPLDSEQRGARPLPPPTHARDHQFVVPGTHSPPANPNSLLLRSTLWWSDLEPWMDEEYAKQVCSLMGWDPVSVRVPSGPSDTSGQPSNNPGYCFLTFPSSSIAASVLGQVNGNGGPPPITMPNSSKPFVLNWASATPSSITSALSTPGVVVSPAQQQYPKEYSIFVGDLAPETSNSDLVAVFRNPVLGLRNDREPKFIRPFLSCKSAKIMLDPVTGVSRGYGFVRFTDEADQQRALIEMHGLYCLSRPMRISPATAKFKPPQVSLDLPLIQLPVNARAIDSRSSNLTVSIPLPNSNQVRSVSSTIASSRSGGSAPATQVGSSGSGSSLTTSGSGSVPSLGSGSSTSVSSGVLTSATSDDMVNLAPNLLAQVTQQYNSMAKGNNVAGISSITSGVAQDSHEGTLPRYIISEESWKHHAQARAILGNLIGPNGEQLTSTDPYNTTVFVGGLSPLISEETLRTFFTPFGDIHYVKVPVGKHCGFVQFVRKADAERAIEKMQGFPIGGSRIRLSWGRSQYKAAQAAAQAAQAAAFQAQLQTQLQAQLASTQVSLSPEQALQLLQRIGVNGMNGIGGPDARMTAETDFGGNTASDDKCRTFLTNQIRSEAMSVPTSYNTYPSSFSACLPLGLETTDQHNHIGSQLHPAFSPFSPDPNPYILDDLKRGSINLVTADPLSQTNPFPPRFDSGALDGNTIVDRPNGLLLASNGCNQYGPYFDPSNRSIEPSRSSSRQEPVPRPTSTQTSSQECPSRHDTHEEQDPIHDLNGTLASLDLDSRSPWKPTERDTSC